MKKLLTTLLIFFGFGYGGFAQLKIGVETGAVFTGYNNVRIPGEGGTKFSFADDFDGGAKWHFRVDASYTLNERHHIIAMASPLKMKYNGIAGKDIQFHGKLFPADRYIHGLYCFNSYRLTYRYDFIKRSNLEFGLGFTAKIRSAFISLEAGDLYAKRSNTGFVPIINLSLLWRFYTDWGLLVEGDALAAPQGRAEDLLFALKYDLTDKICFHAGYRLLEGGSDNESVYAFSMFNYLALGISYRFDFRR